MVVGLRHEAVRVCAAVKDVDVYIEQVGEPSRT